MKLILIVSALNSCTVYRNAFGGIRPSKSFFAKIFLVQFSLKPEESNVFKDITIYKHERSVYLQNRTDKILEIDSLKDREYNKYLIFYPSGRCQTLSLLKENNIHDVTNLLEKGAIGYFNDIDATKKIKCERYVFGDGGGLYLLEDGIVDNNTLIMRSNFPPDFIYKRIETPRKIKNIVPNW